MQPVQFIRLDFGSRAGLVRFLRRPAINKEDHRLLDRVRLTGDRNYLHRDTPQLLAEAGRSRVGQSGKVLLKRTIERKPGAGTGALIGNVLWIVLAGWWLALGHLITGVAMCITIIGIPLGLANFKLIPVSLTPFGREIVDSRDPWVM